MNPSEAAKLLATAAAWDRRTVGEVDAQAWAKSLDGLAFEDCTAAIAAHFRTCNQAPYLMPAHIREHVTQQHRADAQRAHDQAVYADIDDRKAIASRETDHDRALAAMRAGRADLEARGILRQKADH